MSNTVKSLKHKNYLISGGNSGIGLELAKDLASRGATIILLGKNKKKLDEAIKHLREQYQADVHACQFNLATAIADDYLQLGTEISDEFSQLNGLIHCAGILDKLTPLEHMAMAQWQQTLQVNLNARMLLTQTLLPLLKKPSVANLLFIVSQINNQPGQPCWGAYQAADCACRSLAQTLKQELSHTNIQINTLELPATDTALRRKVFPFEPEEKKLTIDQISPYWQELL